MAEVRTTSSTGGQKGVKAQRYDLLPKAALDQIAEVYDFGATKYADHNWRRGYEWSKSYAAAMRHMTAFWDGETLDEESGLPHLGHAGFHIFAMLTWLQEQGEGGEFDDRYNRVESEINFDITVQGGAASAAEIIEGITSHLDRMNRRADKPAAPPMGERWRSRLDRPHRPSGHRSPRPEAVEASAGESPLHENQPRGTFHLAEERSEDAEAIYRAHLADIRDATKDSHPL